MKTNKTFAGIDEQYAKESTAKITLIPVPFDQTSTWIKGADKAVEAFLEAAENMELYDIETDSEVYKEGIFLTDELPKQVDPESMVNWVHQKVKSYLGRNKFVSLFGGEHSISIGAIRAFNEYYQDLTVVQIDAHADLRNVYNGSAYNHACAMYEASSSTNLIQVGIRSMDRSECSVMDYNKVFFADQIFEDEYWMEKAVNLDIPWQVDSIHHHSSKSWKCRVGYESDLGKEQDKSVRTRMDDSRDNSVESSRQYPCHLVQCFE